MAEKTNVFDTFYKNFTDWFEDIKQHELIDMVALVEQAKAYLIAAESLPQEKVEQFVSNLRYDLNEFYQAHQADADDSLYLSLLNEQWWDNLAKLTDKSQVEWAELTDDFKHQGQYKKGDYIGFGILECQNCQQQQRITHLTCISECQHCQGEEFIRKPFQP